MTSEKKRLRIQFTPPKKLQTHKKKGGRSFSTSHISPVEISHFFVGELFVYSQAGSGGHRGQERQEKISATETFSAQSGKYSMKNSNGFVFRAVIPTVNTVCFCCRYLKWFDATAKNAGWEKSIIYKRRKVKKNGLVASNKKIILRNKSA